VFLISVGAVGDASLTQRLLGTARFTAGMASVLALITVSAAVAEDLTTRVVALRRYMPRVSALLLIAAGAWMIYSELPLAALDLGVGQPIPTHSQRDRGRGPRDRGPRHPPGGRPGRLLSTSHRTERIDQMSTITPVTLAAELVAATPALSDEQQQLALNLYRLLAEGQPVEHDQLATSTDLQPVHVTEILSDLPGVYLDDSERVIGFWGLTITPMAHRLLVDDRVLYAWCAWDTLFVPGLIGKPVEVRSACPTTGTPVALTVDGLEVADIAPDGTVLSFLHRDQPFDADAIATFCHYVHFFADRAAAEQWTRQHEGTFVISLADGVEIARLANAARFPTIGEGRPSRAPRMCREPCRRAAS
jgi:alkylmercury lyase